jgi:dihydroorotase
VLPGLVDLGLLVERMTAGGEPFGLVTPSLTVGSPANVCLVDLDAEWEVGEAGYESRSDNCAFAGRRLTGRVRMTIADGAVAYRERSFALGAVA